MAKRSSARRYGFSIASLVLMACWPARAGALSWTDWADLALAAPVVLSASIFDVDRLSKRETADLPPGEGRAIVRAGLSAALKGPGVLPAEAAWRWEGVLDPKGRPPFVAKVPVLVFGVPLSGGGNPAVQPLRLVSRHGQQPWSAEAEALVRDVLKQALDPAARGLMATGVSDAFFTKGDVPGSSESQFFISTQAGQPLTLLVRRSPGQAPEVLAASGDLVDRARPIAPRTLLWRGLACGLPKGLPPALAVDAALAQDYAVARSAIGACGRTVQPPG
jgi:hypothetical protein